MKYGRAFLLLALGCIIQSPAVADADSAASVQTPGKMTPETV